MESTTAVVTLDDRRQRGESPSEASSPAPPTCAEDRNGSPSIAPPYWKHARDASRTSLDSTLKPTPITLEDHTGSDSDRSGALWAKSVTIDDYVLVKGNRTGLGAYVVWNCKVQTLDVRTLPPGASSLPIKAE